MHNQKTRPSAGFFMDGTPKLIIPSILGVLPI